MKTILLVLFLSIISCQKKYTIKIREMAHSRSETEEIIEIKADDDTSAYKFAVSNYWARTAAALTMNKRFPDNPVPVPFFFTVNNEEGNTLSFSREDKERFSEFHERNFKDKIQPEIDTIKPYKSATQHTQ